MNKKSKYSHLSREQIEARLEKLEKEGYGLKWEDKPEAVADLCDTQLPVLKEDKSKEIVSDPNLPTNYIIEGDNYHSLFTLNFTHKKKIDVIYIDPPYNTGNKSWKYNNDYVDKDDAYRHSKWLSFMNKRLRLAKQLLKNTGIIICAIDDYEFAGLKLLLDKIFDEQNRLGTIAVVHNPRGRSDDKFFATSHEYLLIYGKNILFSSTNKLSLTEEQIEQFPYEDNISKYRLLPFKRTGSNSTPKERPNLYYPIYYNPDTKQLSLSYSINSKEILPYDNEGNKKVWRWSKKTFEENYNNNIHFKINDKDIAIYTKDRIKEGRKPQTVWVNAKYDASSHGTVLLQKILGKDNGFNYPKSIYSVKDILEISTNNKNSLILDFFAGSGTTAHAVMELNKEDGGNRQFILCTNNENNICTEVTYPRIKKVIEGYANKEGIPANVKYFTQTFVNQVTSDNDKRELVNRSTELLCMAENTFDVVSKRTSKNDFAIFVNSEKTIAIIYDESQIDECIKKLNQLNNDLPVIIYVFSYDHTYFTEDFDSLKIKFVVKPIPEAILNVYRKINKLKRK